MTHVVVLGHGSRDPRHAATLRSIAATLHERSQRATVGAAFLEFDEPALDAAVSALSHDDAASSDNTVIVVPMLLTPAFHAKVDVPAAVETARTARPDLRFLVADVLGPSPLLIAAMERRIAEAGVAIDEPGTAVLLVAAGSSDETARATVAGVAEAWLAPPLRGAHAFVAGDGPGVAESVHALVADGARRVVVAPYLIADGVLPDRAFDEARRAGDELGIEAVVAGVIGDAPELLDLVPERARNAAS